MSEPVSGAAVVSTFLWYRGEPLLAVARSQGVEIRRADEGFGRVATLPIAATAVLAVPDGSDSDLLLTGGEDGVVQVWAPGGWDERGNIAVGAPVRHLACAEDSDGRVVAIAADGISLLYLDRAELVRVPTQDDQTGSSIFRVCVYTAFRTLWVVAARTDGSLQVGRVAEVVAGSTWMRLGNAQGGPIWAMTASSNPDGGLLIATGSSDRSVRLWRPDASYGLAPERVLQATSTVRALDIVTIGGVTVIACGLAEGSVAMWRLDDGRPDPFRDAVRRPGEVWAVSCLPTADGGILVACGDMHGDIVLARLRIQLLDTSMVLLDEAVPLWAATDVVSVDGSYIAAAGVDRAIHLIPLDSERENRQLNLHIATVRALASVGHPADSHLISGGADHRVADWNPNTGELRREIPMGHKGEVWALATYSIDGWPHVVSGSADGSLRTCGLDSDQVTVLADHLGEVNALVVTPGQDGPMLTASASRGLFVCSLSAPDRPTLLATKPVTAICGLVGGGGPAVVVTVRTDGDTNAVDVIDPVTQAVVAGFEQPLGGVRVTSLTAGWFRGQAVIFGGCDDGTVHAWLLDGAPASPPVKGGNAAIRTVGLVERTVSNSGGGPEVTAPALFTAGHDGALRLWPIAAAAQPRGSATINPAVTPASVVFTDRPAPVDTLGRATFVDTIHELLMSPTTQPPLGVGLYAPWGQGKSSVLMQLRAKLDPTRAQHTTSTPAAAELEPTHELVLKDNEPGLLRRGRRGSPVRTRLSRGFALRRLRRPYSGVDSLPFQMRPIDPRRPTTITIWFNPWMYETPDQIWAGLTREILDGVTNRLSPEQRQRLWFDLNLRRTDPTALRKRIIATYLPRSLIGVFATVILAVLGLTVLTMGVLSINGITSQGVNSTGIAALLLTMLGIAIEAARRNRDIADTWATPESLRRPSSHGLAGPASGGTKPHSNLAETGQRGFLHLLRNDVAEILELATQHSRVVILIDDLDRCGPKVLDDMIEAINLLLTKSIGPCSFVLALEPTIVAAHLETSFSTLRQRLHEDPVSFGKLDHAGWRFLAKIFDLPIRLPRIRDTGLASFLQTLTELPVPDTAAPPPPSSAEIPARPTVAPARTAGRKPQAHLSTAAESASIATSDGTSAVVIGGNTEQGVQLVEVLEGLPPVQNALRQAILSLAARNPRQTKTFVNLWRFYMLLEYRSGLLSRNLPIVERHSIAMARFVEILVRWPWMLDALSTQAQETDAGPNTLEMLISAQDDDERWNQIAATVGWSEHNATATALRELLHRDRKEDAELVGFIARRYL